MPLTLRAGFLLWISAGAALQARRIDSFESAASAAPWIFSNGPEFPGATGSLSRGPGRTGAGAELSFDVRAGGNYVAATFLQMPPVAAGAVVFWVRNPGGVRVQVRVNDSTGQTLQYSPSRPFEAGISDDWYPLTVTLGATADHWGGRNDGIVHGAITSLSILAQPTLLRAGSIDFDDVELATARSTLIDPAAAAAAAPAIRNFLASLGVQITHANATDSGLDLVQALGFRRVRTEMFWADIETTAGVYDFGWYDQLVANLKTRGIEPHFILCYGNPIYTGAPWFQPPRTSAAMDGFGNFARAAAARYAGQSVRFEVWNEPNITAYWSPPDADEFGALCHLATAKIHAQDPAALVVSGGLAGVNVVFLNRVIRAGGVNQCEAIGVHPYRLGNPEQLPDDLAYVRADIARFFPRDPPTVWSTEAGYSSAWFGDGTLAVNRTTQAKLVVRQMLTGLGLGLPAQIVFGLSDAGTDGWNSEDNFGLVDASYEAKPLTAAVQTLFQTCRKHTFAGILASPQTTTHIFKFQGAADTLLVLWTENAGAQSVSFPTQPQRVVDYLGQPRTLTLDAQGSYRLTVSDSPVYVTFSASGSGRQAGKQ